MPEVARTLVKSPPELWAEVSDPESLARHLGEVGEIKITRLEPESAVAWEGDRIRGTVDLAPAGWGTKVTVTAEEVNTTASAETVEMPVAVAPPAEEPEVEAAPEIPQAAERVGFFSRLFKRRRDEVVVDEPEPEPEPIAVVEAEPEPEPGPDTAAVLDGMLGSLGSAHHRPFSR